MIFLRSILLWQKHIVIMSRRKCAPYFTSVFTRSFTEALRKLSEAEFWKRYFQSKLFNAHRASIRSSAAQHVVKEDPIFDKYLEKDDDGMYICGLRYQFQTLSTDT